MCYHYIAMNKKRILIVSVSAGAGHVRAADALKKTADLYFPDIEATHIDMMDYVSAPMRMAVTDSYDLIMKKAPELWQFLYDKTNTSKVSRTLSELTKFINQINAAKFYTYVAEHRPDAIICTNFLPASALMGAPKKYRITAPLSIVMTDYDKHALLLTPGLQHYFVSTEKMKWKMMQNGIEEKRIVVSGIPIDPVFYEKKSAEALKKKYDIHPHKKIILVLSGGQGMTKSDKIVEGLFDSAKDTVIIAIAGKNKKLEKSLRKLTPPQTIDLCIIGWTDTMDEYMRIADVIITKPGGMTTTECIALGKPIIAIEPIAGQEEANALYILENNLGRVALSGEDVGFYVDECLKGGVAVKRKEDAQAGRVILDKITRS